MNLARWKVLKTCAFPFLALAMLFSAGQASAAALETVVATEFDAATIARGYTLESSDGLMRLGIRPDTLSVATRVDIKTLEPELMAGTYPDGKTLLGKVYLFDIVNKSSYDGSDFFFLEIKYPSDLQGVAAMHGERNVYFFNGVSGAWEELPSEDSPSTDSVRALIHLAYARLAIFETSVPEIGGASWYAYKGCDCAASPDYPKGSFLVVSLIDDPLKSVTVRVNDYGPDRSVFPDRVIDLDKVAYEKLAPLWTGLVNVRVQFLQ